MGELDHEGVRIALGLADDKLTCKQLELFAGPEYALIGHRPVFDAAPAACSQVCFAHVRQTSAGPAHESMSTAGYPLGGSALRDRGAGEGVCSVVQLVAAVAGDLVPGDVVALDFRQERLPEVAVVHGLLLGIAPAVLPPALVPLVAEAVHHVGAVAVDRDRAMSRQRAQAFDRACQLHALVGGGGLAAGKLDLAAAVDHDRAPAAGTRIAAAGAVSVDADGGRGGHGLSPLTLPSPLRGEGDMGERSALYGSQ